jgi:predicted phage baseplate assembly protein
MEVEMEASRARGAGVTPDDPPLRWEVSQGDGTWAECEVLDDTTGGFNLGSGSVVVQAPPASGSQSLGGHQRHWLRCRIADRTRRGAEAAYTHAPEIYSITGAPVGALLPATHGAQVRAEMVGVSDGTPSQTFRLAGRPVLHLQAGETLEVQDLEGGGWAPWEPRENFAESGRTDRHFVLDHVSGEIEFGPAVRQPHGGWTQAGAVPPKGAGLRFTRYRHGGGVQGNVAARTLTVLRTPLAGVDAVTTPEPATGGVDAEPVEHARRRAGMEIRSRSRAVTAEDFEFLAQEASPRVARAVCLPPAEDGVIPLHLLPHVPEPDRRLEWAELQPAADLLREVADYLEERRLIGTTVALQPCRLRGLSVVVSLQAAPLADLRRIQEDVEHALYTYLNPLIGGSTSGPGAGWPFGRPLNQGELYGVVHAIEGVEYVRLLRLYETDLQTGQQSPQPAGTHVELEPDQLIASGQHIVKAEHRKT